MSIRSSGVYFIYFAPVHVRYKSVHDYTWQCPIMHPFVSSFILPLQSPQNAPRFSGMHPTLQKMHPAFWEMHPEKRKMNPPIFPGCIFLLKLVRKPISNKIIKIGSRTVHFSLIFRAFSTCQFYGTKAKLLKTEEDIIFCRHIWPQTALEKDIQVNECISVFFTLFGWILSLLHGIILPSGIFFSA